MVGACQLLAALGPFKTVLRFHVIDANVNTILGMPFIVTSNLKTDWLKHKVTVLVKSGQEDLVTSDKPSLKPDCRLLSAK